MLSKNLLLIFTRNPELGKCKTRLAATVGAKNALAIYKFLLNHTVHITQNLMVEKQVYYSKNIWENDIWHNNTYQKKIQKGNDLGMRMENAFKEGFDAGFEKIIVIGSDMFDLNQMDLENAFSQLNNSDVVVGPADDGGYYLIGMKALEPNIFRNKEWGTATVLKDTLNNIKYKKVKLLDSRNDIDLYEDMKDINEFKPFLKKQNNDT